MKQTRKKTDRLTYGESNRVLDALGRIDAAREELEDARVHLITTLYREKDRVRDAHSEFKLAGGATGDDWLDFLRGRPLRGCAAQRGHLRLLCTPLPRRRLASNTETGPSAA